MPKPNYLSIPNQKVPGSAPTAKPPKKKGKTQLIDTSEKAELKNINK